MGRWRFQCEIPFHSLPRLPVLGWLPLGRGGLRAAVNVRHPPAASLLPPPPAFIGARKTGRSATPTAKAREKKRDDATWTLRPMRQTVYDGMPPELAALVPMGPDLALTQGDQVMSTGVTYDDDDCCRHKAEGTVLCTTLEGSVHEATSRHGNSG